jgi:antirestriction protein ArdC
MGGHVRKGEKATPIVFWREIEKDDGDSFWMLRYYSVFNVQQCEGLELADLEIPESDEDPISSAENIISGMPDRPSILHDGEDQAYYRPSNDSIHLPARTSFHSTGDYYGTVYHELAHATVMRPD